MTISQTESTGQQAFAFPDAPADAAHAAGVWRHPGANRHIVLQSAGMGTAYVSYACVVGRRRSIGMVVSPEGLQVRVPARTPQSAIDAVLHAKARWIVSKLQELQARAADLPSHLPPWGDGACFAYLGAWVQVALGYAGRRAVLQALPAPQRVPTAVRMAGFAAIAIGDADDDDDRGQHRPHPEVWVRAVLHVPLKADAPPQAVAAAVERWLRSQALTHLAERVADYAPVMGVKPRRVSLTSAQTRWGSASSSGDIRLHWRLVQMPKVLMDYVLVHELAHLHEMNHGPRFWAWVAKTMPDYAMQRQRLKRIRLEPWAD